jgi:hypothetical protein
LRGAGIVNEAFCSFFQAYGFLIAGGWWFGARNEEIDTRIHISKKRDLISEGWIDGSLFEVRLFFGI